MTDIFELGYRVDTRGLARGEAATKRFTSQVDTASARMSRMGATGREAFAGMAMSARSALVPVASLVASLASVRAIGTMSEQYKSLRNQFIAMGDSADQAAGTLERIAAIANETRAPLDATAQLYTRLSFAASDLGANSQELEGFTRTVGMALSAFGVGANEASGALLQLSQAMSGGVVRAEEFNSILEGAFPIAEAAARGIDRAGGSVGRLREMVTKGEVSSREFFEAVLSQQGQVQAAFDSTALTVGQAMNKLTTSFTIALGGAEGTTSAMGALARAISAVADGVGPTVESLGRGFSALSGAGEVLAANFDKVKIAAMAFGSVALVRVVRPALASSSQSIKGFVDGLKQARTNALLNANAQERLSAAALAQARSQVTATTATYEAARAEWAATRGGEARALASAKLRVALVEKTRAEAAATAATHAHTAAQNGLVAASGRASMAMRGASMAMGAVSAAARGALALVGGPAGLALMVGTVLVGAFMNARAKAQEMRQELQAQREQLALLIPDIGSAAKAYDELTAAQQRQALQAARDTLLSQEQAAREAANAIRPRGGFGQIVYGSEAMVGYGRGRRLTAAGEQVEPFISEVEALKNSFNSVFSEISSTTAVEQIEAIVGRQRELIQSLQDQAYALAQSGALNTEYYAQLSSGLELASQRVQELGRSQATLLAEAANASAEAGEAYSSSIYPLTRQTEALTQATDTLLQKERERFGQAAAMREVLEQGGFAALEQLNQQTEVARRLAEARELAAEQEIGFNETAMRQVIERTVAEEAAANAQVERLQTLSGLHQQAGDLIESNRLAQLGYNQAQQENVEIMASVAARLGEGTLSAAEMVTQLVQIGDTFGYTRDQVFGMVNGTNALSAEFTQLAQEMLEGMGLTEAEAQGVVNSLADAVANSGDLTFGLNSAASAAGTLVAQLGQVPSAISGIAAGVDATIERLSEQNRVLTIQSQSGLDREIAQLVADRDRAIAEAHGSLPGSISGVSQVDSIREAYDARIAKAKELYAENQRLQEQIDASNKTKAGGGSAAQRLSQEGRQLNRILDTLTPASDKLAQELRLVESALEAGTIDGRKLSKVEIGRLTSHAEELRREIAELRNETNGVTDAFKKMLSDFGKGDFDGAVKGFWDSLKQQGLDAFREMREDIFGTGGIFQGGLSEFFSNFNKMIGESVKGLRQSLSDFGSLISTGKTGKKSGALSGLAGIGAVIKSAMPAIGLITAGVDLFNQAKGVWNHLNRTELRGQGLQGTIGGGGASVFSVQRFKKNNPFGRDRWFTTSRHQGEASQALAEQAVALQDAVAQMAGTLRLEASGLSSVIHRFSVGDGGQLKAQMEIYGNLLANSLDGLSSYVRAGESSLDALRRLSGAMAGVNATFEALGFRLYEVGLAGANAASGFADLFGGLQEFTTATSAYYDRFYTDAEKLEFATRSLSQQLSELGINVVPMSTRAFRSLVDDAMAAGNEQLAASLMQLSPSMAQVLDQTESLDSAAQNLNESLDQTAERFKTVNDARLARAMRDNGLTSADVQTSDSAPLVRLMERLIALTEDANETREEQAEVAERQLVEGRAA